MKVDLQKADFVAALPFSPQIEDSQIRAFITDAYTLDILPILGHDTLERLGLVPDFTTKPYTGDTSLPSIAQDDLVERWEHIYQALLTITTLPPPAKHEYATSAGNSYPVDPDPEQDGQWQYLRLPTLWQFYLKPYWLQAAYVRFLLTHGVNVTKAGLTVPVDRAQGTYDRPSSAQVAQLLADTRVTADARLSRLTRFLRQNGLLYHQAGYCGPVGDNLTVERAHYPTNRRHKSRIRGV